MSIEKSEFRPKIVAFCCNWCSYAGADLAGSSRLSYPADVKIIRVPCSCRVNPMFILRAFQKGADGVILCGCHPGDCHYSTGNYYARRRMKLLFSMLDFIGVESGRTRVEWVSAADHLIHEFLHLKSSNLTFLPRDVILSTNSCIVWENFAPSAADTHSTRVRPFSTPI